MKRFIVVLILSFIFLTGCLENSTSQTRMAALQTYVQDGNTVSVKLSTSIDVIEQQIEQAKIFITDPNIDPELRTKLQSQVAQLTEKASTFKGQKAKVDAAIAAWLKVIDNVANNPDADASDEAVVYGTAIQSGSSVLPPPYNGYGYLLGAAIAAFGGLAGKFAQSYVSNKKINEDKQVITDLVISVDNLLNQLPPKDAVSLVKPADAHSLVTTLEDALTILKDAQSEKTRETVRKVQSPYHNTAPSA